MLVQVFFILAALTYAGASLAYAAERTGDSERARKLARGLLAIAALLHFITIGAQSAGGAHPFGNVWRVSSFGAMITAALFFVVARGRSLAAIGALIAPLGLLGLVAGVALDVDPASRVPASVGLTRLHIGLATAGLAAFILAGVVAVIYLTMERRLRSRKFKPGKGPGISLKGLDRMHHRVMMAATPIFTLAIITGVLWIVRAGGVASLGGRWFELAIGGVAWIASVAVLALRAAFGIRGRRAAILTLVAFGCTLAILGYYGVRA